MKKIYLLAFLSVFIMTGCINSGAFISTNRTNVNLGEGDFLIAAANVTGEASSGHLIGFSYSNGLAANTVALIRVKGGQLYADALESLWQNFEERYGPVSGKKVALTNVRYDADILNLFLYTNVKVTVRADVVEFQ